MGLDDLVQGSSDGWACAQQGYKVTSLLSMKLRGVPSDLRDQFICELAQDYDERCNKIAMFTNPFCKKQRGFIQLAYTGARPHLL
ncbi:hypothetical protein [Amantichitinum ursilacus]|uniref:hypothetical protein n=1 Tax=Amantichitinum ursilacus TaxID=857265 RepID=UPI0006B620D7|nr:hypothetical protein [Amantichitinum ursilacus]